MRYVVAVAETRSFTRAAEKCHVVQSALSHQVARLERELGVRLFARTSRKVETTTAGEAFLVAARECLAAAERAAVDAAEAAGEIRGQLTIGVIPTVAAVDVPEVIAAFRERHPLVRVSLRVGASDDMARAVAQSHLDVGLLGFAEGYRPAGVQLRTLSRDRHALLVGRSHRLAGRKRVALADLGDEVFVDFPTGSPGRQQTDRAFAAAGLSREVAFEASTVELMTGLVRRGLAVLLLPSAFVADRPGLVSVQVTGGPARVEYAAWSGFNPSPAAKAFLGLLSPG